MMKSIKRMVLTGAAVMLMMSFAAPAMADNLDPNALYQDSISPSFDPSVYYSPDIGTAGDQISVEAGGPAPPSTDPVVVGPTPVQVPWDAGYTGLRHCWQDLGNGQWQELC